MKRFILIALLILLVTPLLVVAQGTPTGQQAWCKAGKLVYPCPFGQNTSGPLGQGTFGSLVGSLISIALIIAGSVAVIFLILGAYRYITASGNEEQTEGAKKTMTGAIIGLVIVLVAFAIIAIISNILIGGAGPGGTGV